MEGVHVVRDLLTREDFMTQIDLKDDYLAISIHQQYHQLLGGQGLRVHLSTLWSGFSP